MSILFNLNNFNKISQNQSINDIKSHIDVINSKSSSSITESDVENLYGYVKKIIEIDFRDSYVDKVTKLLAALSTAENLKSITVKSKSKKYSDEINKIVTDLLLSQADSKPIAKENLEQQEARNFTSNVSAEINQLLEKINEVSTDIIQHFKPMLYSEKFIDQYIVLPKDTDDIYGFYLNEYINKFIKTGEQKSINTMEAEENESLKRQVFVIEDFISLHFPKFLHIYFNADVSILDQNELHSDSEVSAQIVDKINSYYQVGRKRIDEIYSSKENFGIPFHASNVRYGGKDSYVILLLMQNFLNLLVKKDKYAISFVLDKYFENVFRLRNFKVGQGKVVATENDRAISASFRKSEIASSESILSMNFAVTDNFFKTLKSSIEKAKSSGGYRAWECISINASEDDPVKGLARIVKSEFNQSLNAIDYSYNSIKNYNDNVLRDTYTKMGKTNFLLQRILARPFSLSSASINQQGVEDVESSVSWDYLGTYTKIVLKFKKIPCSPIRVKFKSHKFADFFEERIFNQEVIVDGIDLKVLNNAVIDPEFSGKIKVDKEPNYIGLYDSDIYYISRKGDEASGMGVEENFNISHAADNLESTGKAILTVNGSALNSIRESIGEEEWEASRNQIVNYFALNPDEIKYICDIIGWYTPLKNSLIKSLKEDSASSNFKGASNARSRKVTSDYVVENSVHIKKLKTLIDKIIDFYTSSFKINSGRYGLSNEAFECYSSLGKFILEKKINDLELLLSAPDKTDEDRKRFLEEIGNIKSFMSNLEDVFYYRGKSEKRSNRPEDDIALSTDWKHVFPTFPSWVLIAIKNDLNSYNKFKENVNQNVDISISGISEDVSLGAKSFENLKNLIKNYLEENFDTYELLDLLGMRRKQKKRTSYEVENKAPRLAAAALVKIHNNSSSIERCLFTEEDLNDFAEMHSNTSCYGKYCDSIKLIFKNSGITSAHKKSVSHHFEKDLFKTSFYISYDINDWLRMIARKAYIG